MTPEPGNDSEPEILSLPHVTKTKSRSVADVLKQTYILIPTFWIDQPYRMYSELDGVKDVVSFICYTHNSIFSDPVSCQSSDMSDPEMISSNNGAGKGLNCLIDMVSAVQ